MLQNFNYNGTIIQRREDGFINLTQMCNAKGKRLDVFMKAAKTKEYVESLSSSLQIDVIEAKEGQNGGTWGHPNLVKKLDEWLNDGVCRFNGKHHELGYQQRLATREQGVMEVPSKAGKIDVLTDSYVIEVKAIKKWKMAIGQALVYQLEFPCHKPRIHLYGKASDDFKQMIIAYSSRLGVIATFED